MSTPNIYNLHTHVISGLSTPSVLYATSAAGAKPGLQYQSHNYLRDFPPAETRITDTEIGSLVTVTLNGTVDKGSTSFTLLVPRVNVGSRQTESSQHPHDRDNDRPPAWSTTV
jgi:hypothetical protein